MASVFCFASLLFLVLFNVVIGDTGHCFNATRYLVKETGPGAGKFWGSKAEDVEQCMKLCVRQKQCKSINYDLNTRMCELNKKLRHGTRKASATNVYSEFRFWPAEVDKNCFNRPCNKNEVCIPKTLLTPTMDGNCSYSCMPFSIRACPKPKIGNFTGRNVGSVNVVKCPRGFQLIQIKNNNKLVSGSLHTNLDGQWKQVCSVDWNWKKTQVACRDLLGLEHGGSFLVEMHDVISKSNTIAVKMTCEGTENALMECVEFKTATCKDSKMTLICFKSNVSADGSFNHVTLSPTLPEDYHEPSQSREEFVWVKFSDDWFQITSKCIGKTWGNNETKVACRSMFPHQTIEGSSKKKQKTVDAEKFMAFDCEGEEPHLLHCQIQKCSKSSDQIKLKCEFKKKNDKQMKPYEKKK